MGREGYCGGALALFGASLAARRRGADGEVERGPAAYPQPAWQGRVHDGVIELKR
jgi:hypothetical protein